RRNGGPKRSPRAARHESCEVWQPAGTCPRCEERPGGAVEADDEEPGRGGRARRRHRSVPAPTRALRLGVGRAVPAVVYVSPVHARQDDVLPDAVAVLERDLEQRVEERVGKPVRLEAELEETRMDRVVVVFLALDARVREVLHLDAEAQLSA